MKYWNDRLKNMIKPGNEIEMYFNEGSINNKIIEIRGIVDDKYIVYKSYNNKNKKYFYYMKTIYYFYLLEEKGYLILLKEKNMSKIEYAFNNLPKSWSDFSKEEIMYMLCPSDFDLKDIKKCRINYTKCNCIKCWEEECEDI